MTYPRGVSHDALVRPLANERTNHHVELHHHRRRREGRGSRRQDVRKFLRAVGYDKRADEGRARYAFDSKDVSALKRQYSAYLKDQEAKRTRADDEATEEA